MARASCRPCGPMRRPISAGACACCGRARNIAGAGARRTGRASSTLAGNRIARFAPVNFLNPERQVTRGRVRHRAGLEFGDDRQHGGHRSLARRRARRHAVSSRAMSCRARWTLRRSAATRSRSTAAGSAGSSASIACRKRTGAGGSCSNIVVTYAGGADLPVYLRVTQADGHQAWSSPIYLVA